MNKNLTISSNGTGVEQQELILLSATPALRTQFSSMQ
jgi:hypothetical protein